MKRLAAAGWFVCAAGALAATPPQAGGEYTSLQIASGAAARLTALFHRYAELPYLRIERRGQTYTLRAGFWPSDRAARTALGSAADGGLLRIATYRPESIVRRNWADAADAASPLPLAPPAPAAAPTPRATSPAPPGPAAVTVCNEAPRRSAPDAAELRPFDEADYRLAFDVLVGAGDVESAFRVARQAVASRPADGAWRRRLAQVADWTRRPEVAAEQWQYLFRTGDRSDETITEVLRFAPLLDHPETTLAAWQARVQRQTPDETQWQEIADLYEALAQPRQGADYFEQQFRIRGTVGLLERAALLAEHGGDDRRALRLYIERARLKPFAEDAVLRAVVLLLRRDRLREAYDLMQAHRADVPAAAADFWRILGQTAWELAEVGAAEFAYRRFAETPQAGAADWSRLVYLVRQRHPGAAAELALEAYRRYGGIDYLLLALGISAEIGDRAGQARAYAALTPADAAAAQDDVRFLVLRGQYRQGARDDAGAWADLRRALQLAPDDREVALPAFWFLIDSRRKAELQALLQRWASRAEDDADFWLPYAAAHHALDRYREAVRWYRKEIGRHPDDALLLLNYADALERLRQPGMAERIRRHAWLGLRAKFPAPDLTPPLDRQPELLALARLALLDRPGDPSLALVRSLVERLRGLPAERDDQAQTDDLVLAWAIGHEHFRNARAWLWLRYARAAGRRQPPLWADSQTALQLNETAQMDRLLLDHADGLPIYNRYDTAYALQHWQQALDIAFHGLADNEVDEDLHDRYRQHLPAHANYAQLRLARDRWGALDSRSGQFEARVFAGPRLSVKFGWAQALQNAGEGDPGIAVPGADRLGSVELRWQGSGGDSRLGLFQRRGMAAFNGWRLGQTWQWAGLAADAALDYHGAATDSLPLRLAGYQDSARLAVDYALGKREYLRIAPRLGRYYSQFGDYLGAGRSLDLEAGYRLRTEYPDWRLRSFATIQRFSYGGNVGGQALAVLSADAQAAIAAGNGDAVKYYLPAGSTTWGACLGMGENLAGQNLRDVYTRGWRHYYDVCGTHNSVNAWGYSGMLGVAGSLTGEDHLSLSIEQARGGPGSGATSRSLVMRYRNYF
jgi:hypothetical protein